MFVLLLGTFYIFNLINSFYWNNELKYVTSNKYILMVEVENNHTTSTKPHYISRIIAPWLPVCVLEMTPGLAATICAYMGYSLHSLALVEPSAFTHTISP